MARVLVVDDDRLVIMILEALLTEAGWQVVSARSLKEARPLCDRVDAIVVDSQLPDGDGLQLLREPAVIAHQLPFVLHTGSRPTVDPGVPVVTKGDGADALLRALGPPYRGARRS